MTRQLLFKNKARKQIKKGMEILYDAVRITLGPKGRNVIIQEQRPTITNDGVTVAKSIELKDKFQNMGADLIKIVAERTNDEAGDGTTTAIILAYSIIKEGLKRIRRGSDQMKVKRELEEATTEAIEILNQIKQPIKENEAEQVAIISAEDEEIGKMIAQVIEEVGKDGIVVVEDTPTLGLSKEKSDGTQINSGFISPFMITDIERNEAVYENVPVLITDYKIFGNSEIVPLMEQLAQAGKRELFIIAEDITGEALGTMFLSRKGGAFNTLGIKAEGYGANKKAILEDIAKLTGATFVSEESGMKLESVKLDVLGKVERVISKKNKTIIVAHGDVSERVKQIRVDIETANDFDRINLKGRLARLTGGVAVIKVGSSTETEMKYKRFKIEDTLNATRAAIEEGVVAGGGEALARVADRLGYYDKFRRSVGAKILRKALVRPKKQIAENAGRWWKSEGVVLDPVKVTRLALQNASSMASVFLTTEVGIADEENIPRQI